jgi:hypothetical protein
MAWQCVRNMGSKVSRTALRGNTSTTKGSRSDMQSRMRSLPSCAAHHEQRRSNGLDRQNDKTESFLSGSPRRHMLTVAQRVPNQAIPKFATKHEATMLPAIVWRTLTERTAAPPLHPFHCHLPCDSLSSVSCCVCMAWLLFSRWNGWRIIMNDSE